MNPITLGSLPVGTTFQLYPKYLDGSRRPRYSSRRHNEPWFDFTGTLTVTALNHSRNSIMVEDRKGTRAAFDPNMRIKVNDP